MQRTAPSHSLCPGCGVSLVPTDGPTHRYLESSPACWAKYGELLAREYSDPRYMAAHQLTVDAYAIQHPGTPSPQSIQSVCLHLISLYAALEREIPASLMPALRKQCVHSNAFSWLEPPANRGVLTVLHALTAQTADEHIERVREWAESAWDAWQTYRPLVVRWFDGYSDRL